MQQYRVAGISFEKGHERLAVRPSFGYIFWQFLPAAFGGWVIGWVVSQGFSSPAESAELYDGGRALSTPLYPVTFVLLAALATAVAVGAFASTLRLRRAHVFDKGAGVFRREPRPICPLTAI